MIIAFKKPNWKKFVVDNVYLLAALGSILSGSMFLTGVFLLLHGVYRFS